MQDVIFGDDLVNYRSYAEGTFFSSYHQVLFAADLNKYRPVPLLVMKVLYDAFGPNIGPALGLNVTLNVIAGLLVERLAFALSGRRMVVSVLAATMTVVSRFLLYQMTEVTSMVEQIGYVLLLAMLAAVVALYDRRSAEENTGFVLLAVALEWLLILDHERYIVVAPWLAVMLWAVPSRHTLPLLHRSWPPLAALGAVAFNLGYKALFLRQAVMLGTGGSRLRLTLPRLIDQAGQALASMFGFNHGPAYLVGRDLLAQPYDWLLVPAAVFALVFAALAILAVMVPRPDDDGALAGPATPVLQGRAAPLALAALAALILVPPLITVRLEQRWLVEPFALLVLVGAWAAGRLSAWRRRAALALFAVWTLASVAVDIGLHSAFPNLFFIMSAEGADAVKHDVLERLPRGVDAIVQAPVDLCGWGLQGQRFAELYAHRPQAIRCVGDPRQLDAAVLAAPADARVYRIGPRQHAQDITDAVRTELSFRTEPRSLDLLTLFDRGHISDPRPVDTPTGKGVLLFPMDVGAGPMKGMAVVTGFSYRLDQVPIKPGARLNFELAMALPAKDPVRAIVTVTGSDGKPVQVYSGLAPVHPKVGPAPMTHVSIPLGQFAPSASITLAGETPPGADASAQWVEYLRPRIVAESPWRAR